MKEQGKLLIVIEGPTASGKTALGVELAIKWNTVVVSADSRQFYKELAIGTAKPSIEEQKGVKHYFVDSHVLQDEITSATYAKDTILILEQEFKTHNTIIMVGGSGMFIDAVCIGLDEIPKSNEVRDQLNLEYSINGLDALLSELERLDPVFYQEVDKGNPMRVIRALEAIRISDEPFSKLRTKSKKELFFEVKRFVINHPREILYDRINRRVDLMIENGLLEEAKAVVHLKHLPPLKTVGYTELFNYLEGIYSLKEAIELIKQNTRRYAKRQLTWFRKHPDSVWIDFTDTLQMAEEIEKRL